MLMIFERETKVNFIDSTNAVLGYDLQQDCCEHAEWFISDKPQYDGNTLPEDERKPTELSGYTFDREFMVGGTDASLDSGEWVAFRLVDRSWRSGPDRYIILANSHNGYYSHGFEFAVPSEVKSGSL